MAIVGIFLLSLIIVGSIFAPWLTPYGPYQLTEDVLQVPSPNHPMGTDDLGRDIFSGVIYGARVSLLVGLLAATMSALIGGFVGAMSGYFGRLVDESLMRITELFQVIPLFFLALILVAIFGANMWNVIFAIGVLSWPATARLMRAEFLSLKESTFVVASRSLGVSDMHLAFREILPNAAPPVIINTTLLVGFAILIEAGLGFLGLADPNMISWGYMLNNAQSFLRHAWWMAVFPGVAIFLCVLSINLMGDGMNDALNPRLRK